MAQVSQPLAAVLVAVEAAQRATAVAARALKLAIVGVALREDTAPLALKQTPTPRARKHVALGRDHRALALAGPHPRADELVSRRQHDAPLGAVELGHLRLRLRRHGGGPLDLPRQPCERLAIPRRQLR